MTNSAALPPIIPLTPHFAVASQLEPGHMEELRALGFTALVNNRPDGEAAGQPPASTIAAAARAAGLVCLDLPIGAQGIGPDQARALATALEQSAGPMLAFCRSGTRSAALWAAAEATRGADPEAILATTRAAGYDLGGLRPLLSALSPASPPRP